MTTPTGRHKVLYYTLGLTPPVEHADWVRRDLGSPRWKLRRGLQFAGGVLVGGVIAGAVLEFRLGLVLGALVGGILGALIQMAVFGDYVCRRTLAYYEKKWAKQSG